MDTEQKLELIQSLLNTRKPEDMQVIDVRGRTLLADYFVICSGTSNTHIKALADALVVDGKTEGLTKDRMEGYSDAHWVLVDYGDVVVHIFAREEREYYDIESLWKETIIRLETPPSSAPSPKTGSG